MQTFLLKPFSPRREFVENYGENKSVYVFEKALIAGKSYHDTS